MTFQCPKSFILIPIVYLYYDISEQQIRDVDNL